MPTISTQQAQARFTQAIVHVLRSRPVPTSFLRSFFPTVEATTRYVSTEVERGLEKIAEQVDRGTEGNRNTFGLATEKVIDPPYFREWFDATTLDLYDRLFGSTEIDDGVFAEFTNQVADKLRVLTSKIERAYEYQCMQVLTTGIVTTKDGKNIDYKRKAASLVNGTSTPWDDNANDPIAHMIEGADFLRQNGKEMGSLIHVVMGSLAFNAFLNNSKFKGRADIRNFQMDAVMAPQRNAAGGTLHGMVSIGSYNGLIWTYNEFFDNSSNVSTPYFPQKSILMLPEKPQFKLAFAAVPRLFDGPKAPDNAPVTKGAFVYGEFKDYDNSVHKFDVKSAGVPVPTAVDQMFSRSVLS